MRAPLIVLITIFAVSVLGLALIPGAAGVPMSFFDAFYVMSYTASTIGFGELPEPFTADQRLWVTISIYLTVVGWAYAIGTLLSLLQDRAFRDAVALHRFTRRVRRLREPFFLVVGHDRTGQLLCRLLDDIGRRVVVIDNRADRIEALELRAYRADVPGLVADARDPERLALAGLANPHCDAVLALTDDDEANLAVAMTVALQRPDLRVVARTGSTSVAHRMRTFGDPWVVNAFDRFGDHLRIAMHAPASLQLMMWLEGGPGAPLPTHGRLPAGGRWIMCGYGRFGREFTTDLRAEGLDVVVVESSPGRAGNHGVDIIGEGYDPDVLARAGVEDAIGLVAGTNSDTANLSAVAEARRLNPALFVIARQNRPENAPLFAAIGPDALLVPADVVAHEVFAQLSTPLLWRFLQEVSRQTDAWSRAVIDRLAGTCGARLKDVWKVVLDPAEAPSMTAWLASGTATLGDVLRDPDGREHRLAVVVLMVLRGDDGMLVPGDDLVLAPGDQLLLTGDAAARRGLDTTLVNDGAREYVRTGRHVPTGWLWRRLTGYREALPGDALTGTRRDRPDT
ncbi:NAD-binding protein [Pseudonocardia sp. C8]|nr:NAD-binding protein [Pseudonocardia sp. C8]